MDNVRDPLRRVDRVPAPDLWAEARRRAVTLDSSFDEGHDDPHQARPGGWRRAVTIGVAFAVFAAAAVFGWRAFSPFSGSPDPAFQSPIAPSPKEPGTVDLTRLSTGWTELPYAPPDVRSSAATAWTGQELLVWSGIVYTGYSDEELLDTGYAFDPASGTASPMVRSPLAPRFEPAAAWTGAEFLVWGGIDYLRDRTFGDGAAYDPSKDRWRPLPQAPLPRGQVVSAWTGGELLVWVTSGGDRSGAAYDPGSDSWRTLATPPVALAAEQQLSWTGELVVAIGASARFGASPPPFVAYDPGTDSWTQLPDPGAWLTISTWTGTELVAWGYDGSAAMYDAGSNRWTSLPDVPVDDCEGGPSELLGAGAVLGRYCNEFVVSRPGERAWHNVTPSALMSSTTSFVAGDAFLFAAYGETYAPGAPVSLYAYRAPASFSCGGFGELAGADLARAIVERLSLLRQNRPMVAVQGDFDLLVSLRGLTEFGDNAEGTSWFSNNSYGAEIRGVDDLGDGTYRVIATTFLGAGGEFTEQILLRPARNLAGDECPLVVDEVDPVELATRFAPEYQREGDQAVSVLTFADGSTAEVSFPVPMRPFVRGVETHASLVVRESPSQRWPIAFLHGPFESTLLLTDGEPVSTHETADGGTATLLSGHEGGSWLAYELADWTVLIAVPGGVPASTLARSVAVTQDEAGFPVVSAGGPVALAKGFGEGEGPQITFSDAQDADGWVELSPEGCSTAPEIAQSGQSGSICLADGNVFLNVQGRKAFVTDVIENFQVTAFAPAPG